MKTRMVMFAAACCAGLLLLPSCDETPARTPETPPALATSRPATAATAPAPAPVQLTKPPVLGPPSPAMVLLPDRIVEPQIRVKISDELERPTSIAANKYRGKIESLRLGNGKYVMLNVLPLDTYLQGVLAKEILPDWDAATYRAQAIAARTYALFQISTDGRTKQWDVNADTSSQVYGGIAAETAKARAAVAATRGQVLMTTMNGHTGIFCTFFSSCIGGASQDPFDAWGDPTIGPLSARVTGSIDENSARFKWDREFVVSKVDVTRAVQNWGVRNNFDHLKRLAMIDSVAISKRNPTTGRPTELQLTDLNGKKAPIRAEEFRLALMNDPLGKAPKPYSSNCDIRTEGNNIILYNGKGYGHGIGMSQYGAQNMARRGYSHAEILSFFYPGSSIVEMW